MISGFNDIIHFSRFQWHTCFIQKKKRKKKINKRVSPLNAFPWVVIPAKRGQVEVQFDFDMYVLFYIPFHIA